MNDSDYSYMKEALRFAAKGRGRTSPNPMVGAVVVRDEAVIGKGYHQKAGTPHAEIHALNEAGMGAHGSVLYVTLEPCCHRGRTLPCVDFIIRSKVKRVVIAMMDPNPLVNGMGVRKLMDAGIKVDVGILKNEARELNEFFIHYITRNKPFVILKAAVTLDGRIATRSGDSKWITGEAARERGHEIRNSVDAIMVGVNTILKDNPSLTTRLPGIESRDPARIILDSHLRTPLDARVVLNDSPAKTYIFADGDAARERIKAYQDKGVTVLVSKKSFHRLDLTQVLEDLGRMEITSLLIEGGAEMHASALKLGIVDRVVFFVAPKILGGGASKDAIANLGIDHIQDVVQLKNIKIEQISDDVMIQGDVIKPDGLNNPVYAGDRSMQTRTV